MDSIEDLDDDQDSIPVYDSSKHIVPDRSLLQTSSTQDSPVAPVSESIYADLFSKTNKKIIRDNTPNIDSKWDKYKI